MQIYLSFVLVVVSSCLALGGGWVLSGYREYLEPSVSGLSTGRAYE